MTPPGRPDAWAALVGQAEVVEVLRAAARDAAAGGVAPGSAMTHTWLLTGPPGSGRSVAARAFAAALQCTHGTGCADCAGCGMVLAGTHPDVVVVAPEGLSYGVKDVRALVRGIALAPTVDRWRVVVVEDADRLTEQAGNALLKALEEPAQHGVFVLCAPSVEDVLPTVRSRCRVLALRIPAPSDVAAVLVAEGVDAAMAEFAARAAQGHVGRARRLATDEEARHRRADVLRLPTRLRTVAGAVAAAGDLVDAAAEEAARATEARDAAETEALKEALGLGARGPGGRSAAPRGSTGALRDLERAQRSRGTRSQRDALDRALVDLAGWYRDVLAAQLGASVEPVHPDQHELAGRLARVSSPEATLRRIEAVLACREALGANVRPEIAVEAMALTLRAADQPAVVGAGT